MLGYIVINDIVVFVDIRSDRNDLFRPTGKQNSFNFLNLETLSIEDQERFLDKADTSGEIIEFKLDNYNFIYLGALYY